MISRTRWSSARRQVIGEIFRQSVLKGKGAQFADAAVQENLLTMRVSIAKMFDGPSFEIKARSAHFATDKWQALHIGNRGSDGMLFDHRNGPAARAAREAGPPMEIGCYRVHLGTDREFGRLYEGSRWKPKSGLMLTTSPEGIAAMGFMSPGGKLVLDMGVNPDATSRLIIRDAPEKEVVRLPKH